MDVTSWERLLDSPLHVLPRKQTSLYFPKLKNESKRLGNKSHPSALRSLPKPSSGVALHCVKGWWFCLKQLQAGVCSDSSPELHGPAGSFQKR